jgi:hypothetical protein
MKNNTFNKVNILNMTITSKNGDTTDLRYVFTSLDIYEDIFSNYVTAILRIRDTEDFLKNFPVIGGEYVNIVFIDGINNSARFLDLVVESVLPQSQISNELKKNTFLSLKLVSNDSIQGKRLRFSFKFDTTSSDLMQYLHYEILGNDRKLWNVLDSDTISFYANFWNINQIINYVCDQTIDSFFFETLDDYTFAKLSSLVKQPVREEWYRSKDIETFVGLNSVHKYTFDSYFDINQSLDFGAFGKTVYQPSLDYYGFEKETKLLSEIYSNYELMGTNQPLPKILSSQHNDLEVNYNDFDSALERNLIIQTLRNYNLLVLMNGSVNRKVGDIISFNLPSSKNENILNENFQHKWLILQIRHTIESDFVYKQRIRLFKNAFFNNAKVGE